MGHRWNVHKYHTDQAEYILSTGLTVYLDKWVAEYRLLEMSAHPAELESFSQLFLRLWNGRLAVDDRHLFIRKAGLRSLRNWQRRRR